MATIERAPISGVLTVSLDVHGDDRGRFVETFRQEWLGGRPAMIQGNRSDSKAGVLRGLHYHRNQADYWYVPKGRVFVGLHDLRKSSPTRGTSHTLECGGDAEIGVYIPPGVAHGFQAITDATVVYLVDRYYDASDELGLAWDDPTAAIAWPLSDPALSERDKQNPKLEDIPPAALPA